MPRWSIQELDILRKNYGKITPCKLRQLLPLRKPSTIWVMARKLGLKANLSLSHRKLSLNENFFASPNTLNSYWAGFIAADGCIYPPDYMVHLAQKDKKVIERFIQHLKYSGKAKKVRSKISKNHTYYAAIYSKKLMMDLSYNFNIVQAKSLILEPPSLNRINTLAYITGFIDGDGCIRIAKSRYKKTIYHTIVVKFIGTKSMMSWINSFFNLNLSIGCRLPKKRKNSIIQIKSPLYSLDVSGPKAYRILKEMSNITELQNVRLSRKWKRVLKWEQMNGIV